MKFSSFLFTRSSCGEGNQTFTSQQELAALAAKWPGARLVEIWNSPPGVEPVVQERVGILICDFSKLNGPAH